ncbi:MAG TPA: hypothetical protein VFT05_03020 [Burkholderiaceae bacterium]|nr:hypothetical protein [Burkholderiaceae bacterium]
MNRPAGQRIALDQAAAGMVLAADLLDGHGAVLLPRGAALTDATLASLRRRGVASCTVEPAAPAGATADEAARAARARQREQQLARLQQLFRHCAGHEANATLLQLLTDYRNRE